MTKSQRRISVTFPETDICNDLYDWVKEKGKISNDAAFIRQVLYDRKVQEEKQNMIDK